MTNKREDIAQKIAAVFDGNKENSYIALSIKYGAGYGFANIADWHIAELEKANAISATNFVKYLSGNWLDCEMLEINEIKTELINFIKVTNS